MRMMRPFVMMVITVLLVTACGFRPLYNSGTTVTGGGTSLDAVTISTRGSEAHLLKNELIDRFYNNGYPVELRYVLDVSVAQLQRDIVIQRNDVTSRSQLVLRAVYTLRESETRKIVGRGELRAVGAFNVLGSQYATVVTQENARDNAMRELADKLTLRVAVALEEKE